MKSDYWNDSLMRDLKSLELTIVALENRVKRFPDENSPEAVDMIGDMIHRLSWVQMEMDNISNIGIIHGYPRNK